MQNFVYSLLDPFLRGILYSGRFRAAGLPGGAVTSGAITIVVAILEEFLPRREFTCLVHAIKDVGFVAKLFGFLNSGEVVRTDENTLGGGPTALKD